MYKSFHGNSNSARCKNSVVEHILASARQKIWTIGLDLGFHFYGFCFWLDPFLRLECYTKLILNFVMRFRDGRRKVILLKTMLRMKRKMHLDAELKIVLNIAYSAVFLSDLILFFLTLSKFPILWFLSQIEIWLNIW